MSYDVQLNQGDLPVRTRHITGPAQVAQRLAIKLNTWRSEWFADQRIGLPWLDWKQAKDLDLAIVTAQVRAKILQTPGVQGVGDLTVERTGDRIVATGTIRVNDDDRVVEAEIFGPEGSAQPVGILLV